MTSRLLAGVILCILSVANALAIDLDQPEVTAFIDAMVEQHDFDREELRDTLGAAELKQSILDAIARPAEKTKSWAEYREIFITPERIEAGAKFWIDNEDALRQVSESTGVPMEMLVGIIGVMYSAMSWQGTAAYNTSAKSAHEAKMANILNGWRFRVLMLITVVLPICIRTLMHPS